MIEALAELEHCLTAEARLLKKAVAQSLVEGETGSTQKIFQQTLGWKTSLGAAEVARRQAEERTAVEFSPNPSDRLRWARCRALRKRVESLSRRLGALQAATVKVLAVGTSRESLDAFFCPRGDEGQQISAGHSIGLRRVSSGPFG